MRRLPPVLAVLALLGLCTACHPSPAATRARAAPPERRYEVPTDVERLLVDDAAFEPLAALLRQDIEDDLAHYQLPDHAAFRDRLFDLALLDALDDDFGRAVARLDELAEREPDPLNKIITGFTIRVWDDASKAIVPSSSTWMVPTYGRGSAFGKANLDDVAKAAFRVALVRRAGALPYDLVAKPLEIMRAIGLTFTLEYCQGAVRDTLGAAALQGSLTFEQVSIVVFQRYAVKYLVPVAPIMAEVVGHVIDEHAEHEPAPAP